MDNEVSTKRKVIRFAILGVCFSIFLIPLFSILLSPVFAVKRTIDNSRYDSLASAGNSYISKSRNMYLAGEFPNCANATTLKVPISLLATDNDNLLLKSPYGNDYEGYVLINVTNNTTTGNTLKTFKLYLRDKVNKIGINGLESSDIRRSSIGEVEFSEKIPTELYCV